MRQRRRIGAAMGIVASFVLAGTALGATWQSPIPLASGDQTRVEVVTLSSTQAVVVYQQSGGTTSNDSLYTRRSTNGGQSWASAKLLTDNGFWPDISGDGSDVDIAYNSNNGRVHYAHSGDGGMTFDPSITLSPKGRANWFPAVGRGPGGIVAVAYTDAISGDVAVRVSHDGGATFDPRDIIFGSADDETNEVAVGDGVIYVGYTVSFSSLRIQRSFNNGGTWTAGTTIFNNLWDDNYSIAAEGTHAYVAFERENAMVGWSKVSYRRTLDSGATWSSPIDFAPISWATELPDLALANHVLRAAFVRCTPDIDICINERAYYRQSNNGTSWGSTQRVSPNTVLGFDAHVGAHRPLVVYIGETTKHDKAFSRVKT